MFGKFLSCQVTRQKTKSDEMNNYAKSSKTLSHLHAENSDKSDKNVTHVNQTFQSAHNKTSHSNRNSGNILITFHSFKIKINFNSTVTEKSF